MLDLIGSAGKSGGRVSLRVEVNQKDVLPRLRQRDGEIDGGGRLADTTFLIGDRYDAPHSRPDHSRDVGARVKSSRRSQTR